MKKILFLVFISSFLLIPFLPQIATGNELIFTQIDEADKLWVQAFNENKGDVHSLYLDAAVFFAEKDDVRRGNKEIAGYYMKLYQDTGEITELVTEGRFLENVNLVYEMGYFKTVNNREYQFIATWKKQSASGSWFRELETVGVKNPGGIDEQVIDQPRDNWVKYCAAKNAYELVKNVYTADAYYYNRGRLLQGLDAIAKEYSYMNKPNYNLYLHPKVTRIVQPDLAYEIGQCSGSYRGHYILKWVKEADGEWRVAMDSNY